MSESHNKKATTVVLEKKKVWTSMARGKRVKSLNWDIS